MNEQKREAAPYLWRTYAVHDFRGTGDLLCVVYRVETIDRSRLAWEASVEAGAPPEKFRDACRHMLARCDELNAMAFAASVA